MTNVFTAPQIIKRDVFFKTIRNFMPGKKLTPMQVAGLSVKLDVWEKYHTNQPLVFLSASLGQARWETGQTLFPVEEAHNLPAAKRIAYLTRLYDIKGADPSRARKMGNTRPGDGVLFSGKGDIQLTWASNYIKFSPLLGVDLYGNPSLALDPVISARIMFKGMIDGLFTGKSLANYYTGRKLDAFNARSVVNGDKHSTPKGSALTIGEIVSDWNDQFFAALQAARN
jgi:putative chitinase